MNKRYLLFCPSALINNSDFSILFSFAMTCLTECRGERESTRASLNFLSQIISWRTLKLFSSPDGNNHHQHDHSLENIANIVNTSVAQHGKNLTILCFKGIAGSSPQLLWPALSECICAILYFFVHEANASNTSLNENSTCFMWISSALTEESGTMNDIMDDSIRTTIVQSLIRQTMKGMTSKPMLKMLLSDIGSYCKREKTAEDFLCYTLQ